MGSAPERSATNNGSPGALFKYTRRAPSEDHEGALLPSPMNERMAPPIIGRRILGNPASPDSLNQISEPSPENPKLRRIFPSGLSGGTLSVRFRKSPVPT